jgi:hypothetical protein
MVLMGKTQQKQICKFTHGVSLSYLRDLHHSVVEVAKFWSINMGLVLEGSSIIKQKYSVKKISANIPLANLQI